MAEPDRLIRATEFMNLLGIKRTKFYDAKRAGKFPPPVLLTKRTKVWPQSAVNQVLEDIKAGRLSL